MSQGEEGGQSRMVGGGAGQHTTGASKEMTQEGPDVALAEEETQIPSVSPHNTLANNLANSGLGARAEDDAAVAMEDEIMSQGGEGEHSRMAGGGVGQHTTGASKTSGTMSSGGPVTWTPGRTSRDTPHGRSSRSGSKEVPRYRAGRGRINVNDATLTSGTPAAAATQTTPQTVGCKRPRPDWP